MKKFTIRWFLGGLCVLAIGNIFVVKNIPLPSQPNWLTIIPALAICAAGIGVLIHKERAASAPRTRKEKAELAMACTASATR